MRTLRRALVEYEQATRDAWEADLLAYDGLLLEAAAMLDVAAPAPAVPGVLLTAEQRARLEHGLANAGLRVGDG